MVANKGKAHIERVTEQGFSQVIRFHFVSLWGTCLEATKYINTHLKLGDQGTIIIKMIKVNVSVTSVLQVPRIWSQLCK